MKVIVVTILVLLSKLFPKQKLQVYLFCISIYSELIGYISIQCMAAISCKHCIVLRSSWPYNLIFHLGGRTADEIVSWLKKKTGPPAKSLETSEDVKKFIEEPQVAVVGFFASKDSDEAKAYTSAANSIDDVEFGIVSNAEIAKEYEVEGNGVILFKKVKFD